RLSAGVLMRHLAGFCSFKATNQSSLQAGRGRDQCLKAIYQQLDVKPGRRDCRLPQRMVE
ncbi:MAG: hypothetical protein V1794_03665, partial [Candidatus Glassbacteria bacterium]